MGLGKIVPLVAEPLLPGLVEVWGVATEKMALQNAGSSFLFYKTDTLR